LSPALVIISTKQYLYLTPLFDGNSRTQEHKQLEFSRRNMVKSSRF